MSQSQWTENDVPDLTGKVAIVTGGNGGIGYHTAKVFLEHNASKVYVASRDSKKSHDAIKRLEKETGREAILLPLDLNDLHGTRKAAEQFLSLESKLDILVNNAGIMAQPIDILTKDDYDGQFGVNVLGHFHFTTLLLPALLASSSPRVINVSSIGHKLFAPRQGIDFAHLKGPKRGTSWPIFSFFERYRYYGQSKLGNILLTNELVRRYGDQGLISISLHPGWVATDLTRHHGSLLNRFQAFMGIPPELGAVSQLFAATAPEAKALNGKYLDPLAQMGTPSAKSNDKKLASQMWSWCENELKNF